MSGAREVLLLTCRLSLQGQRPHRSCTACKTERFKARLVSSCRNAFARHCQIRSVARCARLAEIMPSQRPGMLDFDFMCKRTLAMVYGKCARAKHSFLRLRQEAVCGCHGLPLLRQLGCDETGLADFVTAAPGLGAVAKETIMQLGCT